MAGSGDWLNMYPLGISGKGNGELSRWIQGRNELISESGQYCKHRTQEPRSGGAEETFNEVF